MGTAVSNGVLRAWATFAPHNPTNAARSLKTLIRLGCPGDVRPGQQLEARVDVFRVSGQGACAALGRTEWVDLMSTSQTNVFVIPYGEPEFYQIKLP